MKMRAQRQTTTGGLGEPKLRGPPSERQSSEQYSLAKILGVWAAAALPMGALAWVVAPLVAGRLDGPVPVARALIVLLTIGLIWQFVLVVVVVYRERGSLRWAVLKDALWLRAPRSPTTGRVGGRLWLVLIPGMLLFAAEGSMRRGITKSASWRSCCDVLVLTQGGAGMTTIVREEAPTTNPWL